MKSQRARILIVGDSIAMGVTNIVGDEIREVASPNFVDQLRERFTDCQIDVDSAIHRTSSQTLNVLPQLIEQFAPQIVLFVVGGSDADLNWKRYILTDGQRLQHITPIDRFEKNLYSLADLSHRAGAQAIFLSLPEHDLLTRGRQLSAISGRDVVAMLEASGGEAESDRRGRLYADVIERVAMQSGSLVARWTERVHALPAEKRFGADAIHPSEAAHRFIAEVVGELLDRQAICQPRVSLAAVRS